MVGEDLARATHRDAHRSRQRRRLGTCAVVLALLALTGSAAIANGWIFDETPTAEAVPSFGKDASGDEVRTLLTDLGAEHRALSSVTTAAGSVCLVLTGFQMQCVPRFRKDQEVTYFVSSVEGGPTTVWGIARDRVASVDAIQADGQSRRAVLANDAYYVEMDDPPVRLVARLHDGSSVVVPILDCPPSTPDCPD
jgi:hypothetical protein